MEYKEMMRTMSMQEQLETNGGVVICTILGVGDNWQSLGMGSSDRYIRSRSLCRL